MKTLIIDDNELARIELKVLLADYDELDVVGEAGCAAEAREMIAKHKPELLFLDIHMPDEDGFELLESLDRTPTVVFTTADDHYALKAYDVNALDYIVKPVDPSRVKIAVGKVLGNASQGKEEEEEEKPVGRSGTNPFGRMFIKDGERCWFVRYEDLRLIESEANYVRFFFGQEKPMMNRTWSQIEARLPQDMFFRANRRQVINIQWIDEISSLFGGRYVIRLNDGTAIEVSRRAAKELREMTSI